MSKRYRKTKKTGNKGAAYLEYLMTDYCLMHRIDEAKDIGNDFLCEWVYGEIPSQVLFFVQVKTRRNIKFYPENKKSNNGLEKFRINEICIDLNTKEYWRGFGIPVYLFVLSEIDDKQYDCYYRRFTPILHFDQINGKHDAEPFYKVNNGSKFLAFTTDDNMGGFARDLFLDYIRCCYKQGSLTYKNPRELGLKQFPDGDAVFGEVAKEYTSQLAATYAKLKRLGFMGILGKDLFPNESNHKIYKHSGDNTIVTDSLSRQTTDY